MQQSSKKASRTGKVRKTPSAEGNTDPRILKSQRIVRASTEELLARLGFQRITVEHISEHSGVARSTIYRHWPNPKDLLVETFENMHTPPAAIDHGNMRANLIEHCGGLADLLNDQKNGRIVGSLINSSLHDEELSDIHARYTKSRRQRTKAILHWAIDNGDLHEDADLEHLVTSLVAPIFYQRFIAEEIVTSSFVERVVDGVLIQCAALGKHRNAPRKA